MKKLGVFEGVWELLTKNTKCNCIYCESELETHHKYLSLKNEKHICSLFMFRVEQKWKKHLEKVKLTGALSQLV